MSEEQDKDKVNELIEAIRTINEFKKMQDSYIVELEKQNEELREKLAGVEEELDKLKKDNHNPYRKEINEIYKKIFEKKKEEKDPYIQPIQPTTPYYPSPSDPNYPQCPTWGDGTIICSSSSPSSHCEVNSYDMEKSYMDIIDSYIKPKDSFE